MSRYATVRADQLEPGMVITERPEEDATRVHLTVVEKRGSKGVRIVGIYGDGTPVPPIVFPPGESFIVDSEAGPAPEPTPEPAAPEDVAETPGLVAVLERIADELHTANLIAYAHDNGWASAEPTATIQDRLGLNDGAGS